MDGEGVICRKLRFVAEHVHERVAERAPLSLDEMTQLGAVLDALLPTIAVLEERPVPPRFRLIVGGGA